MDGMHGGIASDLCNSDSLRSETEDLRPVLGRLQTRLASLESRPVPNNAAEGHYIMNKAIQCWHWVYSEIYTESRDQRTPCGWPFLTVRHSRVSKFPSSVTGFSKVCSICLPAMRRHLQADHLSDLD